MRHIEKENFRPEKYYTVLARIKINNREHQIPYIEEKRLKKEEAERLKKEIEQCMTGVGSR